jgi:hypothetical protein
MRPVAPRRFPPVRPRQPHPADRTLPIQAQGDAVWRQDLPVQRAQGRAGDRRLAQGPASFPRQVRPAPTRRRYPAVSRLHSAAPKAGPGGPPPPPPAAAVEHDPLGGRVEWYLAVGGVRSGPFSRVEAAQKILTAEPGKTVHVWKEGMPGWKPSEEVSVIARELSMLRPPPPPPPEPREDAGAHGQFAPEGRGHAACRSPKPPKRKSPSRFSRASRSRQRPRAFPIPWTSPWIPTQVCFPTSPPRRRRRSRICPASRPWAVFADVTTKKNKNLRELEAEPLFSTAPALSESDGRRPLCSRPCIRPPPWPRKPPSRRMPCPVRRNCPLAVRVSSNQLAVAVLPHPSIRSTPSAPGRGATQARCTAAFGSARLPRPAPAPSGIPTASHQFVGAGCCNRHRPIRHGRFLRGDSGRGGK